MSDTGSFQSFLKKLRKLKKHQIQQFHAEELLKLRNLFKTEDDISHTAILKVIYFHTLGSDVSFAQVGLIKFVASQQIVNKRIGYIALSIILHSEAETLLLVTQAIIYDLQAKSTLVRSIALNTLIFIGDEAMFRSALPEMQKLILSKSATVQKKALLCLDKIVNVCPDLAIEFVNTISTAAEKIIVPDYNHGLLLSFLQIYMTLLHLAFDDFAKIIVKKTSLLVKIFKDLHATVEVSPEFGVIDSEDPFLQIVILKFFNTLHSQVKKQQTVETDNWLDKIEVSFNAAFLKILAFHRKSWRADALLSTSALAVLAEIVQFVMTYSSDYDLLDATFHNTYQLFLLPNTNLRFMCMQFLSKFFQAHPKYNSIHLEKLLFKAIEDSDAVVRRKALSMIAHLTTEANAMSIAADLLGHMSDKMDGPNRHFRNTLYETILSLVTKYETLPLEWKVDTMIAIMSVQRDSDFREGQQRPITQDVLRMLTSLAGNPKLASFVGTLRQKLSEAHPSESLLYVSLWSIGEYCELLSIESQSNLLSDIWKILQNHLSRDIQLCGLNALVKLRSRLFFGNSDKKSAIEEIFGSYVYYIDEEIQKRASEYLAMSKLITDENLQQFFLRDDMPAFSSSAATPEPIVMEPVATGASSDLFSVFSNLGSLPPVTSSTPIGATSTATSNNPLNLLGSSLLGNPAANSTSTASSTSALLPLNLLGPQPMNTSHSSSVIGDLSALYTPSAPLFSAPPMAFDSSANFVASGGANVIPAMAGNFLGPSVSVAPLQQPFILGASTSTMGFPLLQPPNLMLQQFPIQPNGLQPTGTLSALPFTS